MWNYLKLGVYDGNSMGLVDIGTWGTLGFILVCIVTNINFNFVQNGLKKWNSDQIAIKKLQQEKVNKSHILINDTWVDKKENHEALN